MKEKTAPLFMLVILPITALFLPYVAPAENISFASFIPGNQWVYRIDTVSWFSSQASMTMSTDTAHFIRTLTLTHSDTVSDTIFFQYNTRDSGTAYRHNSSTSGSDSSTLFFDSTYTSSDTLIYTREDSITHSFLPLFNKASAPSDSCLKVLEFGDSAYLYNRSSGRSCRTSIDCHSDQIAYLESCGLYFYNHLSFFFQRHSSYDSTAIVLLEFNGQPATIPVSLEQAAVRLTNPSSVLLFPNPVADILNILACKTAGSAFNVALFDIQGRRRMANSFSAADKIRLNIEALPDGVYFIRIQDGSDSKTLPVFKVK